LTCRQERTKNKKVFARHPTLALRVQGISCWAACHRNWWGLVTGASDDDRRIATYSEVGTQFPLHAALGDGFVVSVDGSNNPGGPVRPGA